MALTEEQVKEIKEQLLKQVEAFPEEQRSAAQQQIETMNAEQLEEFLEKNKLIKEGGGGCIFCSIINGDSPSYKIAENKEAIAILDINPVSEGHTLIIPKEHKPIEEIPSALQLSQEVTKKLKAELAAEDVKIESTTVQGHGIINVIPLYKGKKPERKKASDEDLQALQKKLWIEEKPAEPVEQKPKRKIKISELPKAPIRIP